MSVVRAVSDPRGIMPRSSIGVLKYDTRIVAGGSLVLREGSVPLIPKTSIK